MKKNTIYLLSIIALFTSVAVYGQNGVSVSEPTFARIGDSVHIKMQIELGGAKLPNRSFVLFTPALKWGDVVMELPAVIINGRNRNKAYKRLVALKREPKHIHSTINASSKKANRSHSYSASVPYEPWMSEAEFILRKAQYGCGRSTVPMSQELVVQKMEDRTLPVLPPQQYIDMNFTASLKVPNPEAVKTRSESGRAYLDFVSGGAEIRTDFGDNALELEKIGDMIRIVKNNQYATITGITIEGYASPEGSSNFNTTLSSRRAISLKNFIRNNYGIRENLLKATGRGEDWETLDTLVSQSSMRNKDVLLNIIRGADQPDVRERKLKALDGGATFGQLNSELFPKLRRSDYELHYKVVPFTTEKGKEVIKTAPENLSLNEMFLIAQSYEAGSTEYQEVFETAARVYPNNDISNLNAAANALANKNHDSARSFLAKIKNHDGAYHNNMGVMYAISGDYVNAEIYLEKAQQMGNVEAVANMNEIDKTK